MNAYVVKPIEFTRFIDLLKGMVVPWLTQAIQGASTAAAAAPAAAPAG